MSRVIQAVCAPAREHTDAETVKADTVPAQDPYALVASHMNPYPSAFCDPLAPRAAKRYSYRDITGHCQQQIEMLVADAARHQGAEQQYRLERAYGVYMGWRALVMEHADPREFGLDDRRLEGLLSRDKREGGVQPVL